MQINEKVRHDATAALRKASECAHTMQHTTKYEYDTVKKKSEKSEWLGAGSQQKM